VRYEKEEEISLPKFLLPLSLFLSLSLSLYTQQRSSSSVRRNVVFLALKGARKKILRQVHGRQRREGEKQHLIGLQDEERKKQP
jgi:hypothetical protein